MLNKAEKKIIEIAETAETTEIMDKAIIDNNRKITLDTQDHNFSIEAVSPEDANELLAIYEVYVRNTAISFEYEVPSIEEFTSRIRSISEKYPYLKASDSEGNIAGFAYAGSFKSRKAYDWAVETTIYVKKDCRGRGIGKLLYSALEEELNAMGILNMNACIAYTEQPDEYLDNSSNYFHQSMGFSLVGTFHKCGYKFNRWYDMIWMEKMIGEHVSNPGEITRRRV